MIVLSPRRKVVVVEAEIEPVTTAAVLDT